jgi:hypothetical protein
MLSRQMFWRFATPAAFCFLASTAAYAGLPITAYWVQHKIPSGKFPIHSACMMPPRGQINSPDWAAALGSVVELHLKARGIAISSATDPLTSGASDKEIGGAISDIQRKYSSVLPLIRKHPGEIVRSAFTLGDQVGVLPCSENADILVFVQGAGLMVKDFALLVTIADAKTGEIVAFIQVYPDDASFLGAENEFGPKLAQQLADMKIGTDHKHR